MEPATASLETPWGRQTSPVYSLSSILQHHREPQTSWGHTCWGRAATTVSRVFKEVLSSSQSEGTYYATWKGGEFDVCWVWRWICFTGRKLSQKKDYPRNLDRFAIQSSLHWILAILSAVVLNRYTWNIFLTFFSRTLIL